MFVIVFIFLLLCCELFELETNFYMLQIPFKHLSEYLIYNKG